MGKLKIDCQDKKINLKKLGRCIYKTLGQKDNLFAELVFVSEDGIRQLNNANRAKDSVTDVLSFPTLEGIRGEILERKCHCTETEGRYLYIGSIAVCEERAEDQAYEYGHSVEHEITYLVLHGVLHLMGYDHIEDEDKKQMRAIEKHVMNMMKMGDGE